MARVLSGIQPTGEVHLGNYIGALRQWVDDQHVHDCFYVIVDLHALSRALPEDPGEIRKATIDLAATLLAIGIDPETATLFVQSHVAEHTELAWVLFCLAGFGELRRMTQFKDKASRQSEASASLALFAYPVLQAADILLYKADRVPVGEDQRQHLELTRDIAGRFNQRFGDTFVLPEPAIPRVGARVMDLQNPTAKMSKSAESPAGTVKVTDPPETIRKKVRSAVTDSGREIVAGPDKPAITNLLTIYSVVSGRSVQELEEAYVGKGYKELKLELAEGLIDFLRPLQERYRDLVGDPAEVERVLAAGAAKARGTARETLEVVYDRVGFLPRILE